MFGWVNAQDPRPYGLDLGLWTRAVVADLIERKLKIRIALTAVGSCSRSSDLPPKTSPMSLPVRPGGEVFFWDEAGFRADTLHGRIAPRQITSFT